MNSETLYQLLAFSSLAILLLTLYASGHFRVLRPSLLFFIFLIIQFGPIFLLDARHTQRLEFISAFGFSDFGAVVAEYTYSALAIAYLSLAAGLFATNCLLTRTIAQSRPHKVARADLTPKQQQLFFRIYIALIVVAIIAAIMLLFVDITRQKLSFFYSLLRGDIGAIDYATFRRVTLTNDPDAASIVRLRMNFSIPLMALITATGIYVRRPLLEVLSIVVPFSIVAIFDLTKQGTLVAALVFFSSIYFVRTRSELLTLRKLVVPASVITAAGVMLLLGLYAIQYMGNESVDASVLWQTLYYRVVRSNADCLNMYFIFFQHPLFDQGISTSSVLASLFQKNHLNEAAYIPQSYGALTSFPTLFFAGMWVDFGWPGVVFSSLAAGAVCSIADYVAEAMTIIPIRAAYISCSMFALNYLGQVQFLTSLSTYGIAGSILIFSLLDYLVFRQQNFPSLVRTLSTPEPVGV
jgi:hypothetical protein